MNFIKNTIVAFTTMISLATFTPAMALDNKLMEVIKAVPQINENCSASVIYSDRDKKSGDARTVLLTAKHCVQGVEKTQMVVDFFEYQKNRVVKKNRYIGHVLGTYYKADLALIELDDKKTVLDNVNKIAKTEDTLSLGDDVVTIGYPLGMGINFTKGNFMSVFRDPNFADQDLYHATPDIGPGNSGGALMHRLEDGTYEQVGVTFAVIPGYPFTGVYTGLVDIQNYLKTALPEAIGEVKVDNTIVSPVGH